MYRCNRYTQIFYTLHPEPFLVNFAHPLCPLRLNIVTNILLIKNIKTLLLTTPPSLETEICYKKEKHKSLTLRYIPNS